MQSIGLLTFQRISNYGAVLQGYALQQAITRAGFRCEVIDLLFPVHKEYREVARAISLLASDRPASAPYPLTVRLKILLRKALAAALLKTQEERFAAFCDKYMAFSRRYTDFDELFHSPPEYDGYVTGSDQVWNPTFAHNPEPYFLTFAPEGRVRIAYAPSFGIAEIPKSVWPVYRQWLKEITHLSVREQQGAEIVEEICSRRAEVVLDPTLLLEARDWDQLAHSIPRRPYIFCYALGDPPGMMELCYHLAALTGMPIVKIGDVKDLFNRRIRTVFDAGPAEFLGLVRDASIVVTNSFHGTCFSINYRRPFFAVPTVTAGHHSKNSRLTSLLDRLGLQDRLFSQGSPLPGVDAVPVDYTPVEPRLARERELSLRYLHDALRAVSAKDTP